MAPRVWGLLFLGERCRSQGIARASLIPGLGTEARWASLGGALFVKMGFVYWVLHIRGHVSGERGAVFSVVHWEGGRLGRLSLYGASLKRTV